MQETVKHILLINAYWVSLVIAGLLGWYFLHKAVSTKSKRLLVLTSYILNQPVLVKLVFSFALTSLLLSVVAFLAYLLHAPAIVFTAAYVLFLLLSAGYAAYLLVRHLFSTNNLNLLGLTGESLLGQLTFFALLAVLGVDAAYALYIKSYALASADTYVHLSRMVEILQQGFTADSGFFRALPEVGYHFNLVYALYMPPTQLLGLHPYQVWEYSSGFFRFMIWASIFTLAWHVARNWLELKKYSLVAASATTIFSVGYLSPLFFTAMYPNQLVTIWLTLLFVSLLLFRAGTGVFAWVILVASFLVTTTHSTYALMCAGFMGLLLVFDLAVRRRELLKNKIEIWVYLSSMVILMFGPLKTALYPNHVTDPSQLIGDFPVLHFGIFVMKDPMNPFKAPLFPGSMFWLGTIGLGYLLYRLWRSRSQLGIALVLAIYFPLMVFFPPVFTVLYHVLPLWVIDRFTAMNMLNYISVPIGIFALVMVIAYVLKPVFGGITKPLKEHGILLVTLGLVMALSAYVFTTSYRAVAVQRPGNASYYSFMDRTEQSFGSILKDEAVVVASPGNSFFLAAVAPIDVIGIEEGHTTPAASVKNRASCQQHLLTTFNYEDLKAVNAAYVVIAKYDKDYTLQRDVIISRPYLQQVGQNQDFQVFKFDVNRKPDGILQPAFKACTDFQAIENGSVKS